MPESRQLTELVTNNAVDALTDLLGRCIEYFTDEGAWEDVYFVGMYSLPGRAYLEVLPPRDTTFGKWWHATNRPGFNFFPEVIKDPQPSPIKVLDPSRLRLKAIASEPIKVIEP